MFRFSIIIPTYNREKFIKRAIISILKQEFSDWEIIVVDDGSSDNTKNIMNLYLQKHKNIKYFYKNNEGVGSARNYGVQKAQGDFLIFLDSDDELSVNALAKIDRYLDKFYQYEVFFLGTTTSAGKKMYKLEKNFLIVSLADCIKGDKISGEFLPCLKRNIFSKYHYKFPTDVSGGEILLWLELAKQFQLVYIDYVARIYHFDADNSLVRGYLNKKSVNNILLINEKILKKFKREYKQYNKRQLGIMYFMIARMRAFLGEESWKYFRLGVKYIGWNKKMIGLYFLAIFDYKFILTNFMIKIKYHLTK